MHTHCYLSNTRAHTHIYLLIFYFQERYKEICLKNGIDPKNTHLQIWVKAVGGVKKNRIAGHPRLRASDIYGIIYISHITARKYQLYFI